MEVKATGRSRLGARRYGILGNGQRLFDGIRANEVLPYLEWGISHCVIAAYPQYIQLHAGTLALDGKGVLLAGQSGCGKSTLTAALAARGWQYLSDEFALIDPDTLRLHPFPRALCIKAASFDLVGRLGLPLWRRRPYVKFCKGRVGYVSPRDLAVATESVPIRLLAFLSYVGERPVSYRSVPRAQAAYALAENAFNRAVFGDRMVSVLSTLVRTAPCVALESGRTEDTVERIEALVRNISTSPGMTAA